MRRIRAALVVSAVVAAFATAFPAGATGPSITVPNDPLFLNDPQCKNVQNCVNQQWNLMSDGRGTSADSAWELTKGRRVTIAVLDSGFDLGHEDLVHQLVPGYDFYQYDTDPTDGTAFGHGTGTAGVAGAQQNNGVGGSGVAPGARILPLRVSDTFIVAPTRLAQAIRYATQHGADVISMSIGLIQTDQQVIDAVRFARSHGVVVLDAMANEFSEHPNTPAYIDGVIGVGGIVPDTDGTGSNTASDWTVKATYSNFGPGIDVVAPTDVTTTNFGGGYGTISGTSGATPGAAGVAALVVARAKALGLQLSSEEVTQILRMSADDLVGGPYAYAVGWDRYTGWGRVDALAAVDMVTGATIPPAADLTAPDWYQPVGAPTAVAGTVSARNGPYTWTLAYGVGDEPSSWTTIATGGGSSSFTGTLGTFDPAGVPNGLVTLRLDITDANGHAGQDRQAFLVTVDPSIYAGFPKQLGGSVESAPQFADLNGDGAQELIVADANGKVHAFRTNGTELPGWPVAMQQVQTPFGKVRPGVISSPAVVDLLGTGAKDVLAGGLDGYVYAWGPDGTPLPGWPVPTRFPVGPDPVHQHWESGVTSAPAVGEVDGPATGDANGPEVVVGSADGKVYAFHRDGTAVAGFPVLLQDPGQPAEYAKIVSSAAIGDIDGDGRNEVVIGDGESYGANCRMYALHGDGTFVSGWPVSLAGLQCSGIPVVGSGVPTSPDLVSHAGHLDVVASGFSTRFQLLTGAGTEETGGSGLGGTFFGTKFGVNHDPAVTATDARAFVSNCAVADVNGDGTKDVACGSVDARIANASLYPGQRTDFQHLLSAWSTAHGGTFNSFPRLLSDWTFLTGPIAADVDGDGKPEIVVGDGLGDVYAFHADGTQAAGWPKQVGRWVLAAPAAGDFDGDGNTDIAVATRQGWLYVYSTAGDAAAAPWPNLRGDPANTGNAG